MSATIVPPAGSGGSGNVTGATAPINFNSGTGVISLTGTVPLANGGTGQTTQLLAAAQLGIENMVAITGVSGNTNYLINTPTHAGHVAIDYFSGKNFYIHIAGSTTKGDYKHACSFPHGFGIIGDGDAMDAQLGGSGTPGTAWVFNGCPTNWSGTGDCTLILKNYSQSTNSSGSGLTLAIMTSGFGASAAAITAAGSGYSVGDILFAAGGSHPAAATIAASFTVLTVDGSGAILTLAFRTGGEYTVSPTSPNTPTGGTGTGASLTFTMIPKAVTALADNGCSFMHVPNTGATGLINGNGMLVFNSHATYMRGLAVAAPGGGAIGGPDAGNFSIQYNDFVNRLFRVPFFVAAAYQPSDAGWLDTFTASPITGNCTVKNAITVGSLKYATQPTQNLVFASPNGSTGDPTFRALVAGDIPTLAFSKITTGVSTGLITFQQDALATTPTYPAILTNTTAAAVGAQQVSPALRFTGQGWKTTATAASQTVDFRIYLLPVQGSANPTSTLQFDSSFNGGAFTNAMTLTSGGFLTTVSGISAGANITCSSSSGFVMSGRSQMKSSVDGSIQFLASSGTVCSNINYLEASVTKTTAYTVLVTDAGTAFDNIGAGSEVVFTLPTPAKGLHFSIIVQNAVGCKFTATGSATIRDGGTVSGTNGSIDSTTVGSCLHIVAISTTEWYVDCKNGTWNAPV